MRNLRVAECFYSIQGEGITTGIPAYFIRLASCNLLCGGVGTDRDKQLHDGATWRCDTIEVWLKGKEMTNEQLYEELGGVHFINNLLQGAHIIWTGGEPLLQQDAIAAFIEWMQKEFEFPITYEFETNGTIAPKKSLTERTLVRWNVSPKLSNSGMPKDKRWKVDVLRELEDILAGHVIYKFVVSREQDWQEIVSDYLPYISRWKVVLMPAADTQALLEQNSKVVAEIAKREVVRMCTRMHITIWNQLTGV